MTGSARLSPSSRGVKDLDSRIARLETFERWRQPVRIDFEAVVPPDLWQSYWASHERVLHLMKECQNIAKAVRESIQEKSEV
jgi:hypothetical protein